MERIATEITKLLVMQLNMKKGLQKILDDQCNPIQGTLKRRCGYSHGERGFVKELEMCEDTQMETQMCTHVQIQAHKHTQNYGWT